MFFRTARQKLQTTLVAAARGTGRMAHGHAPLLAGVLVALAFAAQPLWNLGSTGSTDDWRWFTFHWAVDRHTVLAHHQLPVWNPYHCGGNVHLANPQTQFLSPLAWPALPLGVAYGLELFLLLHLLLGYASCWWLARDLGLGRWPAAFSAALFVGSGFFFMHVGGGHSAFMPFLLMPAALAAYRRSLADLRWAALAGAVLALLVLEGGVYPAPYTALLLAAYGTGRFVRHPRDLRPLLALALAGGLAVLLSGVKLLPVLAFLQERPRLVPSDDGMSPWELVLAFTSRRLERPFPGHLYVWPEYGAYLGWPVLLAVLLLAVRRARAWGAWLLLCTFFAALMTGNYGGSWSPHELLHRLPVLRSLHVPSRFGVVVTLLLAILAGAALHEGWAALTASRLRPRPKRWLGAALAVAAVLVLCDVLTFGQWQMTRFRDRPLPASPRARTAEAGEPAFRMTRAGWAEARSFPERGIGTLHCYEPNGVPRGNVRAGLPQEVFLAGGATGQVALRSWSPARVEVEVALQRPGLVVLNQNDHRGWVVEGPGATRQSKDGMPAAALATPGSTRLAFVYRPPGLVPGALLTLLGLLAGAAVLRWGSPGRWGARREPRTAASVAARRPQPGG